MVGADPRNFKKNFEKYSIKTAGGIALDKFDKNYLYFFGKQKLHFKYCQKSPNQKFGLVFLWGLGTGYKNILYNSIRSFW